MAAAACAAPDGVLVPRDATDVADLPRDGSWLWMPRLSGADVCVPAYGLVVAVVSCDGERHVRVVSDDGRCADYSLDALRQHGAISVSVGRVPYNAVRSITDAQDLQLRRASAAGSAAPAPQASHASHPRQSAHVPAAGATSLLAPPSDAVRHDRLKSQVTLARIFEAAWSRVMNR